MRNLIKTLGITTIGLMIAAQSVQAGFFDSISKLVSPAKAKKIHALHKKHAADTAKAEAEKTKTEEETSDSEEASE